MITLDANVMIAALDVRDAHHRDAARLLRERGGHGLLMHPISIAEVLVRPATQGGADEVFARMHGAGVVSIESSARDPLLLANLRARTRLRMPDCCVLLAAARSGFTLATFDEGVRGAADALGIPIVS